MKFFIVFVCMCVFFTALLFSQEGAVSPNAESSKVTQEAQKAADEDITLIPVNAELKKNSRGAGYGLVVGGTVAASFGTLLEISTILTYFLLDNETKVRVSTDSHVFTFLHIASAAFITAGLSAVIAGATYVDDSVYGKKYWKKTQVITGSVLTSLGAAATITGSGLYAENDMKDVGSGIMGGGTALMSSGIVSLFVGLFARYLWPLL